MLCSDSCSAFPEKIVCFGDKGRHEFAPFVCGESGMIEDRHIIHRFQINGNGKAIFKDTREPNYISQVSNAVFVNDTTFIVDAMYTAPNLYLLNFGSDLPEKSWTYRNSIREMFL